MPAQEPSLFAALLRHWRMRRGLSQLDLSLAADVSSKHISFLETGRAQPSREMLLVLGAALDVPLRDQNVWLRAAGFAAEFAEPAFADGLPPPIARAIERMLAQQEPYPMAVMDHRYDVLSTNRGAMRLLTRFVSEPAAVSTPLNVMHLLFDPRLCRPFVTDWERVARTLLSRLQREYLTHPSDAALGALMRSLLAHPDVPEAFHMPDLSTPSEPTLTLRLRRGELTLAFLTTITVFSAPQNVTLEELKVESYFPLDESTARVCERWAQEDR
jgi:transcriptional regulator with XRE-family HTH domain